MPTYIHYVCKYTPLELLAGFGLEPVLLDPRPADFACAEACAHANLCGYGKGVIEEVMRRRASGTDKTDGAAPGGRPEAAGAIGALILTDCCDVMRRVCDILKERAAVPFLYFLPLPHKADDLSADFFAAELEELAGALAAHFGAAFQPTRARRAWERESREAEGAGHGEDRIVLRGAHGNGELLAQARARFSLPVENETCSGARVLPRPAESDPFADGFRAYARALLMQKRPCMRMLREDGTADGGSAAQARGVLFHTVKFCDYYGFAYRRMQRALTEAGVPVLKFETDLSAGSAGQLATRFDAFAETVGDTARTAGGGASAGRSLVAGIDSGSTSTDAVIMDGERHILGSAIVPTGAKAKDAAGEALRAALAAAGVPAEAVAHTVTTGYGRETIGAGDESVTEITCHARGAHFLHPQVRTVVDIGGQDSKVIALDADGRVKNFAMNDKCAAGTGRFMEQMARVLGVSLGELGGMGLARREEITISSMCTVFAESEVVSLIAENRDTADIVYALCEAVAAKTMPLVGRAGGVPAFMMTGGVSQNEGVVRALERRLKAPLYVPEGGLGQLCGAIGAALIALDRTGENGLVLD